MKWNRPEAIVILFSRIFHDHFCPAENIDDARKPTVLLPYFLGWLGNNRHMLDAAALCAAAEVDFDVWEEAMQFCEDPVGPERLWAVWPNVTFASRAKPLLALKKMTWNLNLEWEDGTILPIQVFVTREMIPDQTFRDSTVAYLMTKNFMDTFFSRIADNTLDVLHGLGGKYSEESFNVLMGTCLQVIPQLKPEYHPGLKDWMRLIQATFQPVVPPEAKLALDQTRRAKQSSAPVGGWDVPK